MFEGFLNSVWEKYQSYLCGNHCTLESKFWKIRLSILSKLSAWISEQIIELIWGKSIKQFLEISPWKNSRIIFSEISTRICEALKEYWKKLMRRSPPRRELLPALPSSASRFALDRDGTGGLPVRCAGGKLRLRKKVEVTLIDPNQAVSGNYLGRDWFEVVRN